MDQRNEDAKELHDRCNVVDAHSDLLALDVWWQHRLGRKGVMEKDWVPRMKKGGIDTRVTVIYTEVIMSPLHPYTKALISVVPAINLAKNQKPLVLPGETPNPENVPPGCRFHPRCYCKVERCLMEEPVMIEFTPQHYVACFVQEKMKLEEDGK